MRRLIGRFLRNESGATAIEYGLLCALIFLAIVFWTWMWGAVGAMLALPLSLIVLAIVEEISDQPPERQLPG